MELKVKCPNCPATVPTGVVMDKSTFDSSTIVDCKTSCLRCGSSVTWGKEDVLDISFR